MKLIPVGVLVAVIGTLSTSSYAAWQAIPGAACRAALGSQTSQFNTIGETGLVRVSANSAWVSCPLQRTLFVRQTVYVNLNHPSARETTCKVIHTDYLTGASRSVSMVARGTGNVYAGFNTSGLGTMNNYDTYSVSCNLAQGTTVRGVSWQDN